MIYRRVIVHIMNCHCSPPCIPATGEQAYDLNHDVKTSIWTRTNQGCQKFKTQFIWGPLYNSRICAFEVVSDDRLVYSIKCSYEISMS